MALDFNHHRSISKTFSGEQPNHYITKIQMFSQLSKHGVEKYATSEFEAGGYCWKLLIYPDGNKSKGITDHISLYLEIIEGKSFPPGWKIQAGFQLFLLDQNSGSYSVLEENEHHFHWMKHQCGFDKFIGHSAFNDPSNGYLLNDTCVFGVDVYVLRDNYSGKGECLSMLKEVITYKHTWRIDNYHSLTQECVDSNTFNVSEQKWKLQLYPGGKGNGAGSYLSLYLSLAELEKISPASKIYAEFTLRILDQISGNHYFGKANYWFSTSNPTCGWPRFVSHGYFKTPNVGLLVKNLCLMEAEVIVRGLSKAL